MTSITTTAAVPASTLADDIRRKYTRDQQRRYRETNPDGYRANLIRYYRRTLERAGYIVTAPTSITEGTEVDA